MYNQGLLQCDYSNLAEAVYQCFKRRDVLVFYGCEHYVCKEQIALLLFRHLCVLFGVQIITSTKARAWRLNNEYRIKEFSKKQ